ncbi:conserved hypothetical protein [Bradyrhizobium sp. ORS 285]|uniref:hypothetical protein n=1 Tax=Bradyrhizobium sp. ORS 285 TaxID=115808 RepID=UPI0002405737|nr:hypothetical protein [Bradyrhizobium sp. ORS 285]CCD89436.1 conserved hypothetical protein [Bradyrhizobium sp. ORS 285]SMX58685.1 conserved hypothetical protein [Bradyrhizobium sp. ORS 285]
MTEPDEPLKPDDFPLEADEDRVRRKDGKPIARTKDEAMAHEIAERLNAEEHRREEDKWSA